MKKILCLIDGLGSGGAQRQLVGLAGLLCRQGYDTSLMWYHKISFFRPILEQNNVRCLNLISTNKFTKLYSIYKTIKIQQPDVIISYLDGPCIIACLLKAVGLKYKLIVSERNTTQTINIHERIKFYIYRFADVIVPNSHSQEIFITTNFPNLSDKVSTITNFVDTDIYKPTNLKNRVTRRVISVGRINAQKNVLMYLKVVSRIREKGYNVHFDWYGGKHDMKYAAVVENLYNNLKIDDIFTFHEPCQNIVDEYNNSDIFCLPSIFEGFPNVVCEAMSCGKPIVCSRVCDNPHIVDEGVNGYLFNPFDEDDMFNTVVRVIEATDLELSQMATSSRELAISKFSSKAFIDKYKELIEG